MKSDAAENPVPREILALLSNERVILRETQRAVTPLGGVAVFVAFLHQLRLVEKFRQHMPIQWKSPNQIDPTATFTAFLLAVLAGARRFAHANWLRGDRALHALLGLSHFPVDDTFAISSGTLVWRTCIVSSIPWPSGRCNVWRRATRATVWIWTLPSSSAMENNKARRKAGVQSPGHRVCQLPRLGIAWNPAKNTVVRLSIGLYDAPPPADFFERVFTDNAVNTTIVESYYDPVVLPLVSSGGHYTLLTASAGLDGSRCARAFPELLYPEVG